jgi:hypothetical protein
MCRIQDCDPWRVYREAKRTARKNHQCFECSRVIAKGERYHYATGLDPCGDRWDVFHLCAHCDAAAQWLVIVCGGYLYGGIGEELLEHWEEDTTFRSRELAMAIRGRERAWKPLRGDGLMPVPHRVKLAAQLVMGPIREEERIRREIWNVRCDLNLPPHSQRRYRERVSRWQSI